MSRFTDLFQSAAPAPEPVVEVTPEPEKVEEVVVEKPVSIFKAPKKSIKS